MCVHTTVTSLHVELIRLSHNALLFLAGMITVGGIVLTEAGEAVKLQHIMVFFSGERRSLPLDSVRSQRFVLLRATWL